uniref:Vitellogenin-1-like n=1 Tax=Crocodylus porosus TaxID=8502 RepID=A0A7M4FIM9_CROPO
MRGLIIALTLGLVEPVFSERKVYRYDYESVLLSGLQEKGLARSGIRIKSKVEISGIGPKLSLIRIHSLEAAEYNGIWPRDTFTRSSKLTQALSGQVSFPIKFEYSNGHVGNLLAPDAISEDGLNIYRGILNVLELTMKKTQITYNLQEAGISGVCNTTYVIQENKRAKQVYVTKSKDLNSCNEKAQMTTGSAYTYPCKTCKESNRHSRATATYSYKIKSTQDEAIIVEADVQELHQFTPFNEITGGDAVVEARQKLILSDVQKRSPEIPSKDFRKQGLLRYSFGSELLQLPVHLFKIKNVESQIVETLQSLVDNIHEQVPSDAPLMFLKLVQFFRAASYEIYESVWKQFSSQPAYRRWILDIIPAVADHTAIKFLRHKIERQELTELEAAQAVLMGLHLTTPTRDVVEEAGLILKKVHPRSGTLLHKISYLTYGSLVHKYCFVSESCSGPPLHDLAAEAASRSNEEEIILALKAIGNVGHPASLKRIMKFMPGYATSATDLPLRVQINAVLALRNLIQEITLEIFLNCKIHPQVRMVAAVVLFETKPSLPVLMTLANAMLKEPSMQVTNFIYSYLRVLGRSTAPDLQVMASACRMVIRILSPKLDRPHYRFSRIFGFSIFRESLMTGLAAKYLVTNNAGSIFPSMAMSTFKAHFLGHIADPFEVGMRAEGVQEILAKRSFQEGSASPYDLKEILRALSDWKALPSDKPLASGYMKMFGQEFLYGALNKNTINNVFQAWYGPEGKNPSIRKLINNLQSGVGSQWSKALLSAEVRHIVPTCTGFPMETSLYHASVTNIAGNVQAQITPTPRSDVKISSLMNANIKLRSKLAISMAKDMIFIMGINTRSVQAGLEAHAKVNVNLPLNVAATINIKEKSFKFEIPPVNQDTDVITLRSKTYAVTRNVEDLAAIKMTPVLLPEAVPNIMKMSFDSDSASEEADKIRNRPSSEIVSQEHPSTVEESPYKKNPAVHLMCFNATTFGFGICLERKSIHAAFLKNAPLYYLVGEHTVKLTFISVPTDVPIEKIQITIQAGDDAAAKMVRLVTFVDERRELSREAVEKVKKILDDPSDETQVFTLRSSSSSSRGSSSSSRSSKSTESSSPSSSDSQARKTGDQINLKKEASSFERSKGKQKTFYPFGESISSSSSESLDKKRSGKKRSTPSPTERATSDDVYRREKKHSQFAHPSKHRSSSSSGISSNSSSSSSSSQGSTVNAYAFFIFQRTFLGERMPPGFTIVARAVRSDNKNQGYQATAYMNSGANKVDLQIVVVQLAESNWKACADAVVLPLKAQARLRWGKQCRDYKIEARASTGQLARNPAIQLKVAWTKLPSWIRRTSVMVTDYVPGVAFMLGFSQADQRNPSRELVLRAAATSLRTIDAVIKAPGATLYYQGFPIPFALPVEPYQPYQSSGITAWNVLPEIASRIAQEDQATCELREDDFKTFDKVKHSCSFNKSCNLIVAQDCTAHPKFIVFTKTADPSSFSREVYINMSSSNITIYPSESSSLLVSYNNEPILTDSDEYENTEENIKVYRNDSLIIVEAPSQGLDNVTFDGVILKVTVASWLKGKTCGICGNNDGEKQNDLLLPNHRLAHSCSAFVHSWVLVEEVCSGDCNLEHHYVNLERYPIIDGEESTCYSVDPVLKCRKDCTPTEKESVKVGFHCFAKDTAPSLSEWERNSDKSSASEEVVESVNADVDCSCPSDCSLT